MSSLLLRKLKSHCAYLPVRSGDTITMTFEGMVVIYVDVLDLLIRDSNHDFKDEVERSWIRIKVPPEGFTNVEMFYLLLSSHAYSLNSTSFHWEGSTNDTYLSLWKLMSRISKQLYTSYPFIRENLRDRTADGYLSYRGLKTISTPLYPMITDVMPGLTKYLNNITEWKEAEPLVLQVYDDTYSSDEDESGKLKSETETESASDSDSDDSSSSSESSDDIYSSWDEESEDEIVPARDADGNLNGSYNLRPKIEPKVRVESDSRAFNFKMKMRPPRGRRSNVKVIQTSKPYVVSTYESRKLLFSVNS